MVKNLSKDMITQANKKIFFKMPRNVRLILENALIAELALVFKISDILEIEVPILKMGFI